MTFSLYRNSLMIAYGNFIFRYRNTVFPIGLAILVVAFPPAVPGRNELLDFGLDVAALLVALAGETLRILTVGLEYIKRGGLNKRVYAERLVTSGMFAHCRNPLYVGNVMIALALLSVYDRMAVFLVGGVLVVLTYIAIVAAEEQFLNATFGDAYAAYCRATNRWLPDPRGFRSTLRGMRFNWRRVLLKESSSFYGWIAAAFLLDGIENRFSLANMDFRMFSVLFAMATITFATIRLLKRTRRLQM
jgi:protein-S-isoprenylcysteine O-methyltransferase Ste14